MLSCHPVFPSSCYRDSFLPVYSNISMTAATILYGDWSIHLHLALASRKLSRSALSKCEAGRNDQHANCLSLKIAGNCRNSSRYTIGVNYSISVIGQCTFV